MKTKFIIALSLLCMTVQAQYKQQLRGTVMDMILQKPLPGATVTIASLNYTTVTDEEGLFRFKDMPIGSYRITITYSGFKEATLENIAINSGKETVLNIPMEALVKTEAEVLIKANRKRNKPLNDMSAVSARAFTVEETQKYAAAINDPLRMAVAFPGVLAPDDGVNSIIIRGNSPTGLLWKMEGMDIPILTISAQQEIVGGISILSSPIIIQLRFCYVCICSGVWECFERYI